MTANRRGGPTMGRTGRVISRARRTLRVLLLATPFMAMPALGAQTLNFRTYNGVDGLPQVQVLALHQDRAGYLWFGTYGGLSRFNGRGFTTFTTRNGLASNTITAIAEDSSGALVVGTGGGGVCRPSGAAWRCIGEAEGLPGNFVRDILVAEGTTWVATERGIARLRGAEVRAYRQAEGLPGDAVYRLARTASGEIWAATHEGIAVLRGDRWVADTATALAGTSVRAMLPTAQGLLLGTEQRLLLRTPSGVVRGALPGDTAVISVTDATVDAKGVVWVGTRTGVIRLEGGRATRLTRANGLAFDIVNRVSTDREGNVWFGTDAGASKLVPGPFALHGEAEGLPHPFVRAIAQHPATGEIWVGTRDGLAVRRNGRFQRVDLGAAMLDARVYGIAIPREGPMLVGTRRGLIEYTPRGSRVLLEADGLPSAMIMSLLADSAGAWVGTNRGLARWEGGRVRPVTHPTLPREMAILSMARDSRGRLWLGLREGGAIVWDGARGVAYNKANGLSDQSVWAISAGRDGAMWMGTNGDGAFRVADSAITRVGTEQGLANDFVWQVLRRKDGGVWLFTSRGLDFYKDGRIRHYSRGDGLIDIEGSANASLETSAGDLWLGTGTGVISYSPALDVPSVVRPPVYVERVLRDGHEVDARAPRVPYGGRVLELQFASPSFRDEGATRFRYRLGTDADWSEPTAETTIRYAGLAPGEYTFEVMALNAAGLESERPASVQLTILPAFWQHWLFRTVVAMLVVALIAVLPVLRSHRLEAERRRLTALVAEHTKALEERNLRLEREIAEREEAVQAHARIEDQLRRGQRLEAVGRLAGGIAHDFNNLLTSVVGHADLMADELGEDHPSRGDLAEIRRASDRAASLVSQLLAFSRQQPMRRTVLDLNAIVSESSRMLQRMLGTDVMLETALDPALGRIRADQSQVDQILVNLALNARDAMPHGGTLVIATGNVELPRATEGDLADAPHGPCVLLRVTDSGHGMDDDVRGRAFEPFFTTKPVGKGTGLGLSTVYGIVKQNDGHVVIESAPGAGASFLIYLPRVPEGERVEEPAAGSPPRRPASQGSEVVLVVEDEDAVRALVCRTLRRSGYHVLEAPDGPRALTIAQRHEGPIHLLLSDMIMPGLSGKAVAEEITRTRPDTRVLFMSGHTRDVLGSRGMLGVHTDLIQKPFLPDDLVQRAREALDGRGGGN